MSYRTASPTVALRKAPKAICPSCGEAFTQEADGEASRRPQVYCGLQACYAEGIRTYWRTLGYEATVEYKDGCPRLVGVPVKM